MRELKLQAMKLKKSMLANLTFAPFLENGYSKEQSIEPDIESAQESITWSDHLVFV